jgi:hypothetical protein
MISNRSLFSGMPGSVSIGAPYIAMLSLSGANELIVARSVTSPKEIKLKRSGVHRARAPVCEREHLPVLLRRDETLHTGTGVTLGDVTTECLTLSRLEVADEHMSRHWRRSG